MWPRLRVGSKFFFAVGILLLAVLGVAVAAEISLTRTKQQADWLFDDQLRTTQATEDLAVALDDVAMTAVLRTQAKRARPAGGAGRRAGRRPDPRGVSDPE